MLEQRPPFDVTLAGVGLVEAGAGTGKTWTITALVLRLLLEQELTIGQILVVTYTRAATGELRGRIRNRLIQALAAFGAGTTDDEYLQALLLRHDPEQAAARLRLAIESFDEAAIYTIHSFCQRALAETAFAAGQPFERELLADQQDMLADVARDVWRKLMAMASESWARWLISALGGPEGLVSRVRSHVGRIDALTLAPDEDDPQDAEQAFAAAFATARLLWQADAAKICAWLASAKLHQASYAPEKMQPRIDWLGQLFAGETPLFPLPDIVEFFGLAKITAKRTKTSPQPEHEFFGAVDVLLQTAGRLEAAYENATRRLLHDFLLTARLELAARKRRSGQMAYDDLLADLAHALQGPAGPALAGSLRERYRAALVDEFQDTDPLQLDIFFGIFGQQAHPLIFVGDPKQAIYGFRGADVFAYLTARQQADARYALLENRRSVPPLLTAVNALFARPNPFLLDDLPFEPARAATMERKLCRIDDGLSPLTLWSMSKPGDEKSFTKEAALGLAATAVATDIARLLALAATGRATLGAGKGGARDDARRLGGGDIAVLVRKHHQGEVVKNALARRGIASVTLGGGSVWHSAEAEEIERWLLAVAAPSRAGLVRAALATVLLGADAGELAAWADSDPAWSARQGSFHDDLLLFRERGFM
ncbi:MAG: UvrD-helicase domain-containing protein, partial [Rhodocyclaceae bacterium]|nr:UvrD-helicase domain-containing protein [Rhodocyclaceae bacterium]